MFLLVHSHVYNMFRTLWSVLLFICLFIYLYDIYLLFDSWFIICLYLFTICMHILYFM